MNPQSVKVCIRARPLIRRELGSELLWDIKQDQIKSKTNEKPRVYNFDRVFHINENTSDVYHEIVEPIVHSAIQGFNGTVFAYGQTASGKTYTMVGSEQVPGIIPLAINGIFNMIESTPEREFLLRVSYLEIYNDNLKDLLGNEINSLSIREDQFKNVNVQGLVEEFVTSGQDVKKHLARGESIRQFGSTNMNDRSSRSHTIFKMIIESRERLDMNRTREDDSAIMMAQLNFVDLAGSERTRQTGAEGQRLKEGCYINKSLMVLGQVINQICKDNETGGGSRFINFRDSKLTRILQPSLGGNSLTAIICTITLSVFDETDSTLRFASSAKKVRNKPMVNEVLSDEALLYRQKKEINELRKKITELKKVNELNEMARTQEKYEEKIKMLTEMLLVSSRPANLSKLKQKLRRGTWCPGGLAAHKLGLPPNYSPASKASAVNFSCVGEVIKSEERCLTSCSPKRLGSALDPNPAKKSRMDDEVSVLRLALKSTEEKLNQEQEEHKKLKKVYESKFESVRIEKNLSSDENAQKQIRFLQQNLKLHEDVIEQFKVEKEEDEVEKEKLSNQIMELSAKIVELERREIKRVEGDPALSALQGQLKDVYEQLEETCRENRKLQERCDEEAEKSRELNSSLEELRVTKKETLRKTQECEAKIQSLQLQLDASLQTTKPLELYEKIENEASLLKTTLNEKDSRIRDLESTVADLREKMSNLGAAYTKKSDKAEEDFEKQGELSSASIHSTPPCGERTLCLEEAMHECDRLLQERESMKQQMDDMMFQILEKDSEIREKNAKLENMTSQMNALEEQAQFDRDEKKILFAEEEEARLELEKLRNELKKAQMQKDDTKCNSKSDDLFHSRELASIYEKTAKDAEALLKDTNAKLSNSESEIDQLRSTLKEKERTIEKLQADVESYIAMEEIAAERGVRHLEHSVCDVGGAKEVDESKKELENVVRALKGDLQKKEDELKTLTADRDELRRDVDSGKTDLESLRSEVARCVAERDALLDEVKQTKMISDAETNLLEKELESTKAELVELKQSLVSNKSVMEVSQQTEGPQEQEQVAPVDTSHAASLEGQLEVLQNELERERSLKADLQAAFESAQDEIERQKCRSTNDATSEVEELLEKVAQLRKENSQLETENKGLAHMVHQKDEALLAETNKELDQQRLLEEADQAKKDTLQVIAHERQLANKEIEQLQQQVEEKQQALAKAFSEKDIATHQLNKTQQRCNELQEFEEALKGDLQKKEDELKTLTADRDELRRDVDSGKTDLESLRSEVARCVAERDALLDEVKQTKMISDAETNLLEKELESTKAELVELKQSLVSNKSVMEVSQQTEGPQEQEQVAPVDTSHAASLEGQLEVLQNELERERSLKADLQAAFESAQDEIERQKCRSTNDATSEVEELLEKVAQLRKENSQLETENKALADVVRQKDEVLLAETNKELDQQRLLEEADQAKKDSLQVIAQERQLANKEIEKLQQQVEEKQQALAKALSEKDIATHQLDKTQQRCNELHLQVQELEKSLEQKAHSSVFPGHSGVDRKLEKKFKQVSCNLDLTRQKLEKSEADNKALQEKCKELEQEAKSELVDAKSSLESQQLRISCLEKEVAQKNSMLERNEELLKEKEQLAESSSSQVQDLREEVRSLKSDWKRSTNESEKATKLLREREQEMRDMELAKKDLETLLQEAKENLVTAKDCSTALLNQKDDEFQRLMKEKTKVESLSGERLTKIKEAESEIGQHNVLIKELKKKISNFEVVLADDENKMSLVQLLEEKEDLSEVESHFIVLYRDYQQMSDQCDNLKRDNERLDSEIQSCQKDSRDSESAIREIKSRLEAEQQKSVELESVRESLNVQIAGLRDQVTSNEKEVAELQCRLDVARAERKGRYTEDLVAKNELKKVNLELADKTRELAELAKEHDDVKAQIVKVEAALGEKSNALLELSEKFDRGKAAYFDLTSKHKEAESRAQELASLLDERNKEKESLQGNLDQIQSKLNDAEEVARSSSSIAESHQTLLEKCADLERQVEASKAQLLTCGEKSLQLEADARKSEAEVAQLKRELSTMAQCQKDIEKRAKKDRVLQTFSTAGSQTQHEMFEDEKKLQDAMREIEVLKLEKSKHRSEQKELANEMKKKLKSSSEKDAIISNLKTEVLEWKTKSEKFDRDLQVAIDESKFEIHRQSREIAQAYIDEYHKIAKKLKDIEAHEKDMEKRLAELSQNAAELRAKLSDRDIEVKRHLETISKLETLAKEYKGTASEIDRMREKIRQHSESLTEANRRSATLQSELAHSSRLVETYRKQIDELEKKKKNEHKIEMSELEQIRSDYETKINTLEQQLRASDSRHSRLRSLRSRPDSCNDNQSKRERVLAPGGLVQMTKLDVQELEMIDLKQKQKHLEKELAKYKAIEDKRKAENQLLLDRYNKAKSYIRLLKAELEEAKKEDIRPQAPTEVLKTTENIQLQPQTSIKAERTKAGETKEENIEPRISTSSALLLSPKRCKTARFPKRTANEAKESEDETPVEHVIEGQLPDRCKTQ